nr:pks-nrps hybrid synthetase psoa [Quercus suber]
MYSTGDKAKLLQNGTIVVLGCLDSSTQAKIRGVRTDLRHIKGTIILKSNGSPHDAIVPYDAAEDPLVAYTVFPRTFTDPDMFQHLENLRVVLPLPRYMIPTTIFPLDEFPINVHGNPDRRGIGARNLGSSGLSSESGNQELSSLETYPCNLWKDLLLGVLLNAITIDFHVDFFQLDGNSLLLVALRNRVQPSFDTAFPLEELMKPNTLKCMAVLVQNSLRHKCFDWVAETALPKNIERKLSRRSSTDEKIILLTGSTGYIGPQMIKQLVTDPTVRRIHTVTVRTFVTAQSSKIIQHSGDLSKPYLGFDKKVFYELADEIDVIVHRGAWQSFWENFQLLREINVESIKELTRMAAVHKSPLHFLSSGAVSMLNGEQPAPDGSDGYVASKRASEQILYKAASELYLPVTIHRPGSYPDGLINKPEILLQNFAEIFRAVKSIPVIGGWNGPFDLVKIEELVSMIISVGLGPTEHQAVLVPYLTLVCIASMQE